MAALPQWKQGRDVNRPLSGARQMARAWMMRKCGEEYSDYVAYFNFDT